MGAVTALVLYFFAPSTHTHTHTLPDPDDFDDTGDTVTVFNHEGDGENTEHLQSMDLHDVKTALEKDAELDEVMRPLLGSKVTILCVCRTCGSHKQAMYIYILPNVKGLSFVGGWTIVWLLWYPGTVLRNVLYREEVSLC